MTITRNLTADICKFNRLIIVEIFDDRDMIHTFTVPNRDGFVRKIDRKLADGFFQRTTAWENTTDGFTFKVDHYGE